MDKLEYSIESFKNIQDLIKFADQKSSAVLVVTGLIFTGFIQFFERLKFAGFENITFLGVLTFITGLTTFISLILVVYIVIFDVLKPKKAKHYQKKELSIFYYEHISQAGKSVILDKYENIDENTMLKNILDQQHEISVILNQKTTALRKSFNWLFASVVSVIFFIILSNQL